jgi:uncharacterized membrane protein
MSDPRSHYGAAITPFLIAACVFGMAKLQPERRLRVAVLALATASVLLVVAGPFPGTPVRDDFGVSNRLAPAKVDALRSALALVPDGAPVTSTNEVHPNLASRRYDYLLPVVGRAEWAVIDTTPWLTGPSGRAPIRAFRRRLELDPRWATVFEDDGVVVMKRVGT